MPLHEYRCPKCNHVVEKLTPPEPPATVFCPHCPGPQEANLVMSSSTFRMTPWHK